VSTGVVCTKLSTTVSIDFHVNRLTFKLISWRKLSVENVQDNLSNLLCVNHLERFIDSFNLDNGSVMLLTTGSRIDCTAVNNENVPLSSVQNVSKNVNNLRIKVKQSVVSVVKIVSLRKVNCGVEDSLRCLSDTLLALSNLIVEVSWDGLFTELRDAISWDSP
jgi:hypothetical protein